MSSMNAHTLSPRVDYVAPSAMMANARLMLSLILIVMACVFADLVVGSRSIDVGTDTYEYANFFQTLRAGFLPETRFEPGFLILTRVLSATGMSIKAYQMALFAILLLTIVAAARRYYDYLGARPGGLLTFLTASLMFLFLSPMFVNGATNAVRQGLAALLIFSALLAFHQKKWRLFVIYGALASSFHYSSLMYLACSPLLLLNVKTLRVIAVAAFIAYCTGLTLIVVRSASPFLYSTVMDYNVSSTYRSGVRIDFASFSIFWYLLPFVMSSMVRRPFNTQIKDSTAVYLVMLMPFFMFGWGNFSNRFLLPAYLSASLMVAAIFCFNRLSILRNPILIRAGLIVSSAVFAYLVINQVII